MIWNISDIQKERRIQMYIMDQRNKQDNRRKNPGRVERFFLSSKISKPTLVPIKPPHKWLWGFFLEGQGPERKVHHFNFVWCRG
jgi:hypothetical protein